MKKFIVNLLIRLYGWLDPDHDSNQLEHQRDLDKSLYNLSLRELYYLINYVKQNTTSVTDSDGIELKITDISPNVMIDRFIDIVNDHRAKGIKIVNQTQPRTK